MPDYDVYDSNGDYCGSVTIISGDSGPSGIVFITILYALSILGGISMIETVIETSPICIVPALLGFIVLLIPIFYFIYQKINRRSVSFLSFIRKAIDLSNYLLLILLISWWTMYLSQTASQLILNILAFSFMYFMILSIFSVCRKINIRTGIFGCLVPGIILYLIILGISSEYQIWYLMLIPTYAIISSITILSIKSFNNSVISKLTLVFIVLAIAFEAVFGFTTITNYSKKLEEAKILIEQGDYRKAREILKHNINQEAKTLYAEIRYKDLAKGDIIYNGYYSSTDEKTIDDKGLAFTCLSIKNNEAYFISNDILLLTDSPNYHYDIASLERQFMGIDTTNMVSLDGKENHYFFIPTLEDFINYKDDEVVNNAILNHTISKSTKKQEKEILDDKSSFAYGGKGNQTFINSWFVYDTSQSKFCIINEKNEVDAGIIYNHYYYGVRVCYKISLQ